MVEGKSLSYGDGDGEGFLNLDGETNIKESREEVIKGAFVGTQL